MLLIHQLPCHDTMRFIRASSYGDSQDVIVNVALVAIRTDIHMLSRSTNDRLRKQSPRAATYI
jgi:hypothetical protein